MFNEIIDILLIIHRYPLYGVSFHAELNDGSVSLSMVKSIIQKINVIMTLKHIMSKLISSSISFRNFGANVDSQERY